MQGHAWVQLRLLPQAQWERLSPLTVEPPMEHVLRLYFVWRGRACYSKEWDQGVLPLAPVPRQGSWAVEWGGSELRN